MEGKSCSRLAAALLAGWLVLACAGCGVTGTTAGDFPSGAQAFEPAGARPSGGLEPGRFCPMLPIPQVMDFQVYALPQLSEPPPRVSFFDPVFGTCLARISDHAADPVAGDHSTGIRPEAAAVQAFNADASLVLARSGGWYWYVYAADTLQMVSTLPVSGELEVRWDRVATQKLWILAETRLQTLSLATGALETVHDFRVDFPNQPLRKVGTGHLGSPSADGRYWPLLAESLNGQQTLLVYDQVEDRILAQADLPAEARLNGVLISHSGQWVLAWFQPACPTSETYPVTGVCGVMVFNQQLGEGRLLLPQARSLDMALDAAGREVLVYHGLLRNSIAYIDLATGEARDLWLIDPRQAGLGLTISGRAAAATGWALVSTYGAAGPEPSPHNGTWMDNAVFAMELKPDGRVARLAHTFSNDLPEIHNEAWSGPQATVSADFTRVLFTSNWGRAREGHMDIVMVGLPAGWTLRLPP